MFRFKERLAFSRMDIAPEAITSIANAIAVAIANAIAVDVTMQDLTPCTC